MPGGLTVLTQDDFSGGIFQAPAVERMPANGSYDIVNGLVDSDEGVIYRRGGAVYKTSANIGITPTMIWDGALAGGHSTLVGDGSAHVYQMDVGDTSMTSIALTAGTDASAPPAVVGGMAFWPYTNAGTGGLGWIAYGGSAAVTYGLTLTVNTGDRVVNNGGAWSFGAPVAGQILSYGDYLVPIVAVGTSTLTLAFPWPGPLVSAQPANAVPRFSIDTQNLVSEGTVYLLGAANRLWWMSGGTIRFTEINTYKHVLPDTNYHEIPTGETIRGGRNSPGGLLVFTNGGVWAIRNPGLDLTDASGNPQQQLALVYPELRLWHINGVASWKGALIVPSTDDVYLVDGVSAPVAIGTAVGHLYRSYVAAGYTLGQATISNGTYVLPVLNGTTWVDTLVLRLATRSWTRAAGYSGQSVGFATRISTSAVETMLSIRSQRVLDCTGWFTPTAANKNEADGSTHTFSVTTRDYTLGSLKSMVKKIRVWLEGVDAGSDSPTLTAAYSDGPTSTGFTSLTGTAGASDGESPAGVFMVNHADKHMRFRFTSTSPWASLKIKALDVFVRPRGRV